MSGRGASVHARIDSPLNRLRLEGNLTIPFLASSFGVSTACVNRWLTGSRRAPAFFVEALRAAAIGDLDKLAQAQQQYAEHRRRRPKVVLELVLPPGVDEEAAKAICVRALAEARRGRP